jgi:hypothetical protein
MTPADGRRSLLHEPIRKARTANPRPTSSTTRSAKATPARPAPATPAQVNRKGAFLLAIIGLCAIGIFMVTSDSEGRGALTLVEGSEIQWDANGRIVQVAGPDPVTVLKSFCLASIDDSFQPVRVIATALRPGRLGIMRRSGEDALVAIRIREDLAAGKWVAGDGVHPLELLPAPGLIDAEAETHNNSDTAS